MDDSRVFYHHRKNAYPQVSPTPVLGSGNFIFFLWLCHFWMVYTDGLQQYVLFLVGFFVVAGL